MFGIAIHNPAAWVGLAALGAPVLIHLLTRRTPRNLVFPTIRFIRRAESNLSSLFHLRHWILLLLRMAIILAVLLAFLRLASDRGSVAVANPKAQQRAVMIVLDGSMSMGFSRAGGGPLSRARQAARKIVDSLGANDRCNLIVAQSTPRAIFSEPGNNLAQLRREVQDFKPTLERADFSAAIAETLRQLAPIQGARKEIHFISDFQRANWEGVDFAGISEDVASIFISVAEANPQNLAITEVRAVPGDPVIDEPVEVICKVANFGRTTAQAPLTLQLGDEPPLERSLDLKPGMILSTSFRIRARKTGSFEATLQLPPDDLPADNFRHFVLPVADRIEALILTDEAQEDSGAAHRFLRRALDPLAGGRASTVRCVVRAPDALTKPDLAHAHLVLLCGVRELAAAKARMLLDYVRQGGGLVYFLSSPADKTNLATLAQLAGKELSLPFELGSPVVRDAKADPVVFGSISFDDPMLRLFRDVPELNEIRFDRYFTTRRKTEAGQVLMAYRDGNIAMARQPLQLGSLLLCNFSLAPSAGDLVRRTLFVPLMHEVVGGMRPQAGAWRSFLVGSPCGVSVPLDPKAPPVLHSPGGVALDAVIEPAQGEAMLLYPRTEEHGFYRVKAGERVVAAVPVNVDPRESNLEALTVEQLKALAGGARRQFLAAHAGDPEAMNRLVEGRIIWPWCLMAGLLLLALEQGLTLAWRR